MSRPSVIFVVWALFLAVVAALEWTVFTHHTPNYYLLVALPAFAIGGTVALAAVSTSRGRTRVAPGEPSVIADLSLPSALIGIALTVTLWGSFIGEWLLLIGAGLIALGGAGLIRELRQARRLREAALRDRAGESVPS
jgi:peptidoglycan/LPS O-acetylase OafA/YrhL